MTRSRQILSIAVLIVCLGMLWLTGCVASTPEPPTPTLFQLPTVPQPTGIPGADAATPEDSSSQCTYGAVFVENVTIPDNTQLEPNAAFSKTWRMRNTGTCAWERGVELQFIGGSPMTNRLAVEAPPSQPGDEFDITLEMTAPEAIGEYTSVWQLVAPGGIPFGTRPIMRVIVAENEEQAQQILSGQPIPTSPSSSGAATCVLDSEFISDVSIPDDTPLEKGEPFTKTWRIRNSGSCDWIGGYTLVFVEGDRMGADQAVPINPTEAGMAVDVSVGMIAPAEEGTYTGRWQLRAPDGTLFGIRPYVRIIVTDATPTPTPEPTTAGTTESASSPFENSSAALDAYVANVTARARQIFLSGQSMGNQRNVFSKVGDSITETWYYLGPFSDRSLWLFFDYEYLKSAAEFYSAAVARTANSFANDSLAATGGWSSFEVLDPGNADPSCKGMPPIECEYEFVKPAVAIIMVGTNDDDNHVASGAYRDNLNRIIEISINRGVIPVLSTIPYSIYRNEAAFNAVIKQTAYDYEIPFMDYYTAMQPLPNQGISEDGVHPSIPWHNNTVDFGAEGLQYGYNMRNLLTLHTLYVLWQQALY